VQYAPTSTSSHPEDIEDIVGLFVSVDSRGEDSSIASSNSTIASSRLVYVNHFNSLFEQ
jgi:hypothetical protein